MYNKRVVQFPGGGFMGIWGLQGPHTAGTRRSAAEPPGAGSAPAPPPPARGGGAPWRPRRDEAAAAPPHACGRYRGNYSCCSNGAAGSRGPHSTEEVAHSMLDTSCAQSLPGSPTSSSPAAFRRGSGP